MTIAKLHAIRRLMLGVRAQIDGVIALIEAELRERGALHDYQRLS